MQAVLPAREDLNAISRELENAWPDEVLCWAVQTYGPTLAMATAFGAEGCVLLDMLAKLGPKAHQAHLFNLDTGYQFAETLQLRERIQNKYGLHIELVRPEETVEQMEARLGGPIYHTQPDACCRMRKIVPLRQTLQGHAAWISAIRRDQTRDRANHSIVEWDEKFGLVKISPLASWTKEDVWAYIIANDVPVNPLHQQGYPSIGCQPCTHHVQQGEDERAGRWRGMAKTECGIHSK